MATRVDAAGNLIGTYPASESGGKTLVIGSHLDTVPDGGKYDGLLGVLLGVAAVKGMGGRRRPFAIDVIGFSEEEGVRYRTPYIGSLAAAGKFDLALLDRLDRDGVSMADAFRAFGLDPSRVGEAAYPAGSLLGYIEAHIEQGTVLEAADASLGVITAIAGQSRLWLEFVGKPGHAGTLPMDRRRDALTAAAEFVLEVESMGHEVDGLRATVGAIHAEPGATNVVPGRVRLSLDVRHADDGLRKRAVATLLNFASDRASDRGILFRVESEERHAAVPADPALSDVLAESLAALGHSPLRLVSGAGHDAAVMASVAPMAMLFLRSPGGVSHHPGEAVRLVDVRAALGVLLDSLGRLHPDDQNDPRRPLMDPFGTTRTRLARDHALIAPESFVRAPLPGWTGTRGVILIAPRVGANFVQYLAEMEAGGMSGAKAPGVERFGFVLEGSVTVEGDGVSETLGLGGYFYEPPDLTLTVTAAKTTRLNVFEKRAVPAPDTLLMPHFGHERDVEGLPFLGDPGARLQTLLPDTPAFDMAVNLFTYDPGATLPMVECHVMEHGLLMLAGQGVYRLGESYYPVREGDVIFMAPFCPQWFVAMGKTPARYLYYKDVNRDPLARNPAS